VAKKPTDKPDKATQKWLDVIGLYENTYKKWEQRVKRILDRYRDEQRQSGMEGAGSAKFNILWSNVQTSIPAVFSRLPRPDVSRRHKDNDPVGRVAALLLERGLEFEVDHYPDYCSAMKNSVQDRFLGGRGIAWVRYDPDLHQVEGEAEPQEVGEVGEVQVTEDVEPMEEIGFESSPTDYVNWKDFGHSVARTWEEVTTVWRKVYMGRDALVERFGAVGETIPLDTRPTEKREQFGSDAGYEACIYELWDKPSRKAIWISKSLGKIIDEKDDPLGLENFWPCPRPLYATLTTDSLIPVPDFVLYQDQAKTLDLLAERIDGLIQALQIKGTYDAATPELARLFTEGVNNSLIPVKNWAAFVEKGGLKNGINLVDVGPIAMALKECYAAVEEQKAQVYEITGLADIIRGSSDPNETATAQKMKGQFGSMRLRAMQNDVAAYAAELLQIKAQIIAKHYQPQTIIQIGSAETLTLEDQALVPQALQLLKDAPLRDFRIEVTADSMIQMDEIQEKQDATEFLTATSNFMKNAIPAAEQTPQIAPLLLEMLKFAVSHYKIGKTLEGIFDETADKLKQAAANPQPKPDPAMAKVNAQAQADQQRMQMEAQQNQQELAAKQSYDQWKAQLDSRAEMAKQQFQAEENARQQQIEAARQQQQAQLDAQLEAHKAAIQKVSDDAKNALEVWKAQLDAKVKIEVAEINATKPQVIGPATQQADQAAQTPGAP